MDALSACVDCIAPLDERAMAAASARQDSLTKPRGSLGKLERLSIQLAGIYRTAKPSIGRKVIFTMAADHGVTAEGVSAYPSEVTTQMVLNFARGGAAINVLAKCSGADVMIVDMGIASPVGWPPGVVVRSVARGTANMAKGPAMSREAAVQSLTHGAKLAADAVASGATALAVGDMGIGNTTSASALAAAFTGRSVVDVTGRGTGVDDRTLAAKVRAIGRALDVNRPDPMDGIEVLSKVGGFEIGGMAGVILGGASKGVPVFLDGFVAGSAALVAASICPASRGYMVASHVSVEPGHRHVLEHLRLEPLLDLGMRLGEGTGAALAFTIADASCRILNEMATFEDANVSKSNKERGQ